MIYPTKDKGFVLVGSTVDADAEANAWVGKLDGNGDITWQHSYGGEDMEWAASIVEMDQGGYMMVGHTTTFALIDDPYKSDPNRQRGTDLWLLRLTPEGELTDICINFVKGGDVFPVELDASTFAVTPVDGQAVNFSSTTPVEFYKTFLPGVNSCELEEK